MDRGLQTIGCAQLLIFRVAARAFVASRLASNAAANRTAYCRLGSHWGSQLGFVMLQGCHRWTEEAAGSSEKVAAG